jgi:hypothetical protein
VNVADEAKNWFDANGEDLAACLLHCFFHGWVYRLADFLLLAEEVYAVPGQGIVAVGEKAPKNCWFLYYLGHARGLYTPYDYMAFAPHPLPFVAYKRRGKTYIRAWDRLRRDFNIRLRRMEMSPMERSAA